MKIAITGGFSAGKSYISELIKKQNYPVFSSDQFINELYLSSEIKKQIEKCARKYFPDFFFSKQELANAIFTNKSCKKDVEKIVHAEVLEGMEKFSNNYKGKIIFFEVPLLFEASMEKLFDKIICVHSPKEIRLYRTVNFRNIDEKRFYLIESEQMIQEKMRRSDYLIDTSSSDDIVMHSLDFIIKQLENENTKH